MLTANAKGNIVGAVPSYPTARSEATPEFLQTALQTMPVMQQQETELLAKAKAAADKARQTEWEFHNAFMATKPRPSATRKSLNASVPAAAPPR